MKETVQTAVVSQRGVAVAAVMASSAEGHRGHVAQPGASRDAEAALAIDTRATKTGLVVTLVAAAVVIEIRIGEEVVVGTDIDRVNEIQVGIADADKHL